MAVKSPGLALPYANMQVVNASLPVSQLGAWSFTLSGSASVTGTVNVGNLPATQPVSGAVSISGTPTVNANVTFPTTQQVSVSNFPASQAVTGTFWQATQPISASSLPLPTGAATAAGVASVVTTLGSPLQQTGGTVNLGTLNGAATSAKQDTIITTLGSPLQTGGSVAVTALPALPTGTNVIGAVTARGAANIVTAQVAVSATTATLIAVARANRQQVKIIAHEGVVIWYGGSNVTKTTGFRVPGVEGASVPIDSAAAVYAIANNATTVSVMELF
jgi:hypothetical protein